MFAKSCIIVLCVAGRSLCVVAYFRLAFVDGYVPFVCEAFVVFPRAGIEASFNYKNCC